MNTPPVAGRYEELGAEGFHSLYRWYQRFEAQHFPDPAGLRDLIARYTLHAYPGVVQAAMALFDVPEAIAVTRTAMCTGPGSLSRLQVTASAANALRTRPCSAFSSFPAICLALYCVRAEASSYALCCSPC